MAVLTVHQLSQGIDAPEDLVVAAGALTVDGDGDQLIPVMRAPSSSACASAKP